MGSVNGDVEVSKQLTPESMPLLADGISVILSRWTGLQLMLSEERYPQQKLERFSHDIFSWFTQSKEPLFIDDLEDILDEGILLAGGDFGDGSIEEVAYNLMVVHEECLQGKCDLIEKLRKSSNSAGAVSQSRQGTIEDDEPTDMVVGDQKPRTTVEAEDMVVDDEQKPRETVEAEEEWTVVSSRRKQKRSSRH
ncbi:Pre-rRNA-processing protein TSR2 [Macleaya cordata]|uniref:Pre-rRNA-processing protein TSR2 n=1 Tax=Macleaya cordata TaxID=56857 RepID=A0A200PZA7_MACCD|nr:Pre-rRNA-processing protein TSR2 [Macleaya cordata]